MNCPRLTTLLSRTLFWLLLSLSLTACLGGGGGGGDTAVAVNPADNVASLQIRAANNRQPADGASGVTLNIIARDSNNLPVSDAAVNLEPSSSSAVLSAYVGYTDAGGQLSVTVSDSVPGVVIVTATAGRARGQIAVDFTDSSVDPRVATVELNVANNFQPADGSAAVTLTVVARDSRRIPLPNVTVSLSSTSASALFAELLGITGADGQFTTTVTDSREETFQVTAIAGGMSGAPESVSFVSTDTDSPVQSVQLSISDNLQPADGVSAVALTVVARDRNQMPLAEVPVSLSTTSRTASFASYLGITGADGRFTTTVTNSAAETFDVTAIADGVAGETGQVSFVDSGGITDSRVAQVQLNVTANFQPADGESPVVLTVVARDRNGMPLAGVPVSLNTTSRSALFADYLGTTGDNGQFTTTVTGTVAERFQVTAIAGGLAGETATVSFYQPVSENPVFRVDLSVNNNFQLADGVSAATLTVVARDANGMPLAGVAVSLRSTSDSAQFGAVLGTTGDNGQFVTTVTNTVAETFDVTAGSASVSGERVSVTFLTPQSIDPRVATVELSVVNNEQPADGSATIGLTVIARDSGNMPLTGVAVTLDSDSATAQFGEVLGTTGDSGRFTTTVTNTVAENVEVVAIVGGVPGDSRQITFTEVSDSNVDSRVNAVQVSVLNNFQPADGTASITLSVVARDQNNVPLADLPVTLVSSSPNAVFTDYQGITSAGGQFTTSAVSSVAEIFNVTVTAGGKNAPAVDLTFVAPVTSIELTSAETLVRRDSTTEATVRLLQGDGNGLADTEFNAAVSGNAWLLNVPVRTDAGGTAHFKVGNNHAENVTLTVTAGQQSRTLPLYFGAALSLLPQTGNALESADLIALLKDGRGTPLADQTIAFRLAGDANQKTLEPVTATTGADGTTQVTVRDLGRESGLTVVEAASGQTLATAQVNFLQTLPSGYTLSVAPPMALRPRNRPVTLTVSIRDSADLPVNGENVTLSLDGQARFSDGTQQIATATDFNGNIQVTVSDSVAENVTLTVSVGTTRQTVPLYFGAQLDLSPAQSEGLADGSTPRVLIAFVKDAEGAGIPGATVNFRVSRGNALLNTYSGITSDIGRLVVEAIDSETETVTVEARSDALAVATARINFSFIGGDVADNIDLAADRTPVIQLGDSIGITATVLDENNLPVQDGTRVNFTATDAISGEPLGQIDSAAFTENGKAGVTFHAGTVAGTAIISASTGTVRRVLNPDVLESGLIIETLIEDTLEAGLSVVIEPSDATGSIEVLNVEPQAIGIIGSGTAQTARLQFEVKDPLGNRVANDIPVTFRLDTTRLGGGETLATGTATGDTVQATTVNGIAEVILRSGVVAGVADVIATVQDTVSGETFSTVARVSIVGGMPEANHLDFGVEHRNLPGWIFGCKSNIVAFVGDRFGNVVPDGTRVNFITEGGFIGESQSTGAFEATTDKGQAPTTLQVAPPTVPELGGADYLDYRFPQAGRQPGNVGFSRVVLYTTGSETFADLNGNGVYDSGEPFRPFFTDTDYEDQDGNGEWTPGEPIIYGYVDLNANERRDVGEPVERAGYIDLDLDNRWDPGEPITNEGDMSEPFIDANDSTVYESGELYVDVNGNGMFDGPDGIYQQNTTIWSSHNLLFSAQLSSKAGNIVAVVDNEEQPANGFEICLGDSLGFRVEGFEDEYGNALPAGSTLQIQVDSGELGGPVDITMGDEAGVAEGSVDFSLSSEAPSQGVDPEAKSAKITVTITYTSQADCENVQIEEFIRERGITGRINLSSTEKPGCPVRRTGEESCPFEARLAAICGDGTLSMSINDTACSNNDGRQEWVCATTEQASICTENERIGAVCTDGTVSSSGSNTTCSGSGNNGINYWICDTLTEVAVCSPEERIGLVCNDQTLFDSIDNDCSNHDGLKYWVCNSSVQVPVCRAEERIGVVCNNGTVVVSTDGTACDERDGLKYWVCQ